MLPFGVTIPATVPQRSEIPEGLMNYPVFINEHLDICGELYNLFVRTYIIIVLTAGMMNFCEINSYRLVDRFIHFSNKQPDSVFHGFILYLTEYGT
jgi:hypothetical protein